MRTGGEIALERGELAEWCCFTAQDALAAKAGGADELFRRQLEAVTIVLERLEADAAAPGDRRDGLRCLVCKSPLTPTPGLIGWLKPLERDALGAFALCWPCAMDGSDDFRARLLAALGGEGAAEIPAGRA